MGLGDVHRLHRSVLELAVFVHSVPAHDFDLRDADDLAAGGSQRGTGGGMKKKPDLYGLMAEFDDPSAIVAAARQAYDEGYRKMNAYSPFPIEELAEAIGFHSSRLPLIVL